jgi:cytosine/adenosine deaminase-related metal-dependent hydrolase
VVLDWDALDDDALFADTDPLELLLARGNGRHIADVLVGGRTVVAAGRVVGVDEAALRRELLARTRAALAADAARGGWRAAVQALAQDLAPFHRDGRFDACCG